MEDSIPNYFESVDYWALSARLSEAGLRYNQYLKAYDRSVIILFQNQPSNFFLFRNTPNILVKGIGLKSLEYWQIS